MDGPCGWDVGIRTVSQEGSHYCDLGSIVVWYNQPPERPLDDVVETDPMNSLPRVRGLVFKLTGTRAYRGVWN